MQNDTKQLEFSQNIQGKIKEFYIKPNLYRAEASELENMFTSGREVELLGDFPNIPLKIIGRDEDIEIANLVNAGILEDEAIIFENLIQKLNKSKIAYSKKAEFILAKGSGHNIHLERPELVIRSVEEVLKQVMEERLA